MLQKSIMDMLPELKIVPIASLTIPIRFQRAIEGSASLRNIEHIQKNLNWAEFGTLLVCKPTADSNKYNVIDGQHRLRALELRDDVDKCPCSIITPRSIKEQAQIFVNINSRRTGLTPLQYHRAALVAGDPVAQELARVCEEAGVVIPNYSGLNHQMPPESFQAPGRIRAMIQKDDYDADKIIWAFKSLRKAYPDKNGILRFNLVKAVMHLHERKPDITQTDAVRALRAIDVDNMDLEARKIRITGKHPLWKSYSVLFEREYITLTGKAA